MLIELPAPVRQIIARLEHAGYEAYCVGGCVRDCLLGQSPGDWDLTTSATPAQTAAVFADCPLVTAGIKHGTVGVVLDKTMYEITTYRVDGDYTDNRHPEAVRFTPSLTLDLARRDFTVNAMAWNEKTGLVDPFGGQTDLERGVLRTVGDPDERFAEDGLRIMRALRFSSTLGFPLTAETAAAVHRGRTLLQNISAERLASELVKLLCGKDVFRVLMACPDVLSVFIPEIAPTVGFAQYGPKHAYDVWEHTCHTVEGVPPDKVLRLTMLLHDLGKVPTHTLDEAGASKFTGHAAVGAQMAKTVLTRLRFDKKTVERVTFLVAHHDFMPPKTKTDLKKALKTLTPDDVRTLLIIKKSDRGALSAPYRDISAASAQCLGWLGEIERDGDCCTTAQLALKGDALLRAGAAPASVGTLLDKALDAVIEGRVPNEPKALLTYLETNE